jgi:hypothetical protein
MTSDEIDPDNKTRDTVRNGETTPRHLFFVIPWALHIHRSDFVV